MLQATSVNPRRFRACRLASRPICWLPGPSTLLTYGDPEKGGESLRGHVDVSPSYALWERGATSIDPDSVLGTGKTTAVYQTGESQWIVEGLSEPLWPAARF
jgi:hypothetical protein